MIFPLSSNLCKKFLLASHHRPSKEGISTNNQGQSTQSPCLAVVRLLGLALVLGTCGGCQHKPVSSQIHCCETLTYVNNPPVSIPVSAVRLHIGPQARDCNSLALISLPDMLRQWSKEHWCPSGGNVSLDLTLASLSLTTNRIKGMEHSKPSKSPMHDVFQGRMVVVGEWKNAQGSTVTKATWTLYHEKTVPSHYTLQQRQALWYDVYVGLINQLTQETDAYMQIRSTNCENESWDVS